MSADEGGPARRSLGGGGKFDAAIDRAVREVLDVEPRADLRERVLRRIEAGGGSSALVASAFRRKILWSVVPLAAAAVLIVALLPSKAPVSPPDTARVTGIETPGTPANPSSASVSTPRAARASAPSRAVRSRRAARTPHAAERVVIAATVDPATGAMSHIAPLETITPIEVAPMAQHVIAPAEIAVRPLDPIAEVQVAPLNPPARRN